MSSHGSKIIGSFLKRLDGDTSGLALIYTTVALPVIVGMALLAVDVGRLWTLQSSLQNGADALALAGAGELDRGGDSITRAEFAIDNMLSGNKSLFGTSVVSIYNSAVSTCYLETLPANDATPIDDTTTDGDASDCLADSAANARITRFVRVKVNPQSFHTIFPATFVGAATNTANATAEAVAGFDAAVCNFTPIFMCNPLEPPTGVTSTYDDYGLASHVSTVASRRKAILFTSLAGNGPGINPAPGQYGFLDPSAGHGKKPLGDEIASTISGGCYVRNTLSTKTGSMTDLVNAFNTRFDLWKGSYKKDDYDPAANTRKGYVVYKKTGANYKTGDACKASENNPSTVTEFGVAKYLGVPVDSCFKTSTCSPKANVGNGDWQYDPLLPASTVNFETYWNTNFNCCGRGTIARPSPADLGVGTSTVAYDNDNPPSRYDLYKYENTHSYSGTLLKDLASVGAGKPTGGSDTIPGEKGLPNCDAGSGVTTPDRRIIYGAIINCRAEGIDSGNQTGKRAVAFGKFFMIRPMEDPPAANLWLELVDLVHPGDNTGVNRDLVQLYR